jgi:hypothetical protein
MMLIFIPVQYEADEEATQARVPRRARNAGRVIMAVPTTSLRRKRRSKTRRRASRRVVCVRGLFLPFCLPYI